MIDKDSIIASTKKLLNIEADDQAFDTDIIMLINSEFLTLHQLGIGPDTPYVVTDYDQTWNDFSDDKQLVDMIKIYVYLRVRLIFDPPASSVVSDAINARISELEWRLNIQAETNQAAQEEATTE